MEIYIEKQTLLSKAPYSTTEEENTDRAELYALSCRATLQII